MTVLAAHAIAVLVKAADSGWGSSDELDGINSAQLKSTRDLLEATDFKDTSACRKRIAGLKDGTIEMSGDYEAADAPQDLLRSSKESGADIYVWIKWDGTAGHKVACLVESFDIGGTFDGKVQFSCSLVFNGAVSEA